MEEGAWLPRREEKAAGLRGLRPGLLGRATCAAYL